MIKRKPPKRKQDIILSVIIPIFQAERYLRRCLESLCCQNLVEYELICIIDGATDNSLAIVCEFQNKYNFVRLIQQDHKGVSAARNMGLQHAEGKYILFVDADDTIRKNSLKMLINKIKLEQADILVFAGNTNHRFQTPFWIRDALTTRNYTYESFHINALLSEKGARPSVCNKLWKKELFQEVEFLEQLTLGEDQMILFLLFPKAGKIVFWNKRIYCYYIENPDSAMRIANEDLYIKVSKHLDVICFTKKYWNELNYFAEWKDDFLQWAIDLVKSDYNKLSLNNRKSILIRFQQCLSSVQNYELNELSEILSDEKDIKNVKKSLYKKVLNVGGLVNQYGWRGGIEAIIGRVIFFYKNRG